VVRYRYFSGGGLLDDLEIIVWVVATALAIAGEVFTTSFFLIFFAFGALVALLLAVLGIGLPLQILGFIVASVASMLVLRPAVLQRLSSSSERYEPRGSIVGRSATVTTAIEPGRNGTVRVGSGEFWTARALRPGERIEPGSRVRILDTDGVTVLVETVEIGEGGERS
jgi:membrane protein implicated in regulation of membrane protease activity